jgi:hypothetical protein
MSSACMRFPKYPTADPCISATRLPSTRDATRGLLDWEDQVPKRPTRGTGISPGSGEIWPGYEMRHSNWRVDLHEQECSPWYLQSLHDGRSPELVCSTPRASCVNFSPVGKNGTSLRLGFGLRFAFSISWKISDDQIG